MEVIEADNPKSEAGKALAVALRTHVNKPILLMVSGGSAFSLLDSISKYELGTNITLTVLDERFSTDVTINNFSQLEETNFYKTAVASGVKTISTKVLAGENLEALQERFDLALHSWREENEEGVIIATMGIGSDGHTAGILPVETGVDFAGAEWVVGYTVAPEINEHRERVTVTETFLRNQVNETIVYAVGREKYSWVQKINSDEEPIKAFPALILRAMMSVKIFTNNEG